MRGGNNRKTIEQHVIDGTYRRNRHGELTAELKKIWYKNKNKKNEPTKETENLYNDIIKYFYDDSDNNKYGFIINLNNEEYEKRYREILNKYYEGTDINIRDIIREVVKNEFNKNINISEKRKRAEYIEKLKTITPIIKK
jgi:hypothetical protein